MAAGIVIRITSLKSAETLLLGRLMVMHTYQIDCTKTWCTFFTFNKDTGQFAASGLRSAHLK